MVIQIQRIIRIVHYTTRLHYFVHPLESAKVQFRVDVINLLSSPIWILLTLSKGKRVSILYGHWRVKVYKMETMALRYFKHFVHMFTLLLDIEEPF